MRAAEEMLDEIESADDGYGPDPVATVDDPALARIAVAQMRLRAAERALDGAVMAARDAGLSWQTTSARRLRQVFLALQRAAAGLLG